LFVRGAIFVGYLLILILIVIWLCFGGYVDPGVNTVTYRVSK